MPDHHPLQHTTTQLPEPILHDVVAMFKALSDPTRTQLIYVLTHRSCTVNELSTYVNVAASTVSHHLAKLRDLRLVQTQRVGTQIHYSIDDHHIAGLFREALFHLDHLNENRARPADLPEEAVAATGQGS
jgi:DNA-binding transcriptional ArsR family regulator